MTVIQWKLPQDNTNAKSIIKALFSVYSKADFV